ncbi:MAG: LPXTG cell wall anchor domain-containing protein [Nanoarchaeota archaeon]
MKKSLVFAFAFLILLTVVSAANESLTIDEKAVECLSKKVEDKCSKLSFNEQAFSLLALSGSSNIQKECRDSLESKMKDKECWTSPNCDIKDTSLGILAFNHIGKNTDKPEKWLLSKNKTPDNLEWYLEIDVSGESECTISYDDYEKKITIADDKKISGNPGNCFSLAYNNYWLKIQGSCIEKKITISCKKDFVSTILYKKTNSNVWHISNDIQSASANSITEHEVRAYCFGISACNYEDNLWAIFALQKLGYDVSDYLPYLNVFADSNNKYFPYSFLYSFTNSEDYLNEILLLQKDTGFWLMSDEGKFYDTSLAILALPNSEAENNAIEWLAEQQGNNGCWNNGNIQDTAFLLWATWPKNPVSIGTGDNIDYCEDYNHYCISKGECDEAGGDILEGFYCSGLNICCDEQAIKKPCNDIGGKICDSDEQCSTSTILSLDSNECCTGLCEAKKTECEEFGYSCRLECSNNEEPAFYDCNVGEVCCGEKTGEQGSSWWIWFLIILIALVALGIIFRKKLRVLIFKFRSGFKKGTVSKTRPGYPPFPGAMPFRRILPRYSQMPRQNQSRPGKKSSSDKELDETLHKLREMSK